MERPDVSRSDPGSVKNESDLIETNFSSNKKLTEDLIARLTAVSASDTRSPLLLTQQLLWESQPFYSAFTRYSDLNGLSQRKLCVFVWVLSFTTKPYSNIRNQTGKILSLFKPNFPPLMSY